MTKIKLILFLAGILLLSPAFSQMQKKQDTLFVNIQMINSSEDDYSPFWVDGSLMFTSKRKNVQEGQSLQYSEKVYFSSKKGDDWTNAQKNGYKWNSDNNTALIGVTATNYYFYRSYWRNNGEIFTALREEDPAKPWKASDLKKLKNICTDDFDECAITFISNDSILFVSNRNGNYDIFLQVGNQKTVSVDMLNTDAAENDVFYSSPNKTLYFSSNRSGGIGGWDIYKSKLVDNQFTTPILIPDTIVNTVSDDRDYRWYNDTTIYLSSNRPLGIGGFDIYEQFIKKEEPVDTIPKQDTAKLENIAQQINVIVQDTVQQKDTIQIQDSLTKQLIDNGLIPFKGEVQFGAFRYITSVEAFKARFPCMKNENIRMDILVVDGIKIHKFIVDTVYTDVDEALQKRLQLMNEKCLPHKLLSDMPFVGVLDKTGNRFAIFWEKDEFTNEKLFYLFKNGKQVWKGRRF